MVMGEESGVLVVWFRKVFLAKRLRCERVGPERMRNGCAVYGGYSAFRCG